MSPRTIAAATIAIALAAPTAGSAATLKELFKDWKQGEVVKSTDAHKFGKTCGFQITSRGTGPAGLILKKLNAEKLAITHWETAVTKLDGAQFAKWSRAKGKSVTCEQKGTDFLCKATANPCT